MTVVSEKKRRKSLKKAAAGAVPEVASVQASGVSSAGANVAAPALEVDMPFPVTEAEIDLATAQAKAVVKRRKQKTPEVAPVEEPTAAFPIPTFEPPRLGLQELPLNSILASDLNPRKKFDKDAIRELAVSIYKEGLQQNLVVRPHPERHGLFEIAAGERRWRAMSLLATTGVNAGTEDQPDWFNWEADHPVPVLVRELTDLALLEVATAENVQRRGFTRLEEADAFAAMLDYGATVDSLHEHSGLGKRTILRRVQIARHLIPELREMYESKKLSLQQVEVLALGTASAQESLLKNQLRYSAHTTPEQLRMLIQERVFETSRAQFPRSWYTGQVTAVDLFGEMPEHFADFDLAFSCQARHAVELAKKDVAKGAAFSDVREQSNGVNFQYAEAYADQGGTVYWVNTQSGELRRYEGKTRLSNASAPTYQFEGTRVVPTHETPERTSISNSPATSAAAGIPAPATSPGRPAAAAPAPAAPVVSAPQYPTLRAVANEAFERVMSQSVGNVQMRQALYVLEALSSEYGVTRPALVQGAIKTIADASDGALIITADGDLSLPEVDEGDRKEEERVRVAALRNLLQAPAEALDLMFGMYLASELDDRLGGVLEVVVSEVVGFELSEGYLGACNHEALLEMWQSAALPEEPNAADEYLRAMLLEEWPALKARGWMPAPLLATAAD